LKELGKLFNRVGIFGFIVIIIAFILILTDQTHKNEVIDTWLLFKGSSAASVIIIIILFILLLTQQMHYHRYIRILQERIDELGGKKSNAFADKLGKKLATSKKK
jgi:NADH:ubiquinone oxidoreductase subunit 6 (subunit J)